MIRNIWLQLFLVLWTLACCSTAYATAYFYTDRNGVYHFTNIEADIRHFPLLFKDIGKFHQDHAMPSEQTIMEAQKTLKRLGYDPGEIDGAWGAGTSDAIKKFQKNSFLQLSGKLDKKTMERLGLQSENQAEESKQASQYTRTKFNIDPKGDLKGCVVGNCQNGIGIFMYSGTKRYDGQFRNGKPNGKGRFLYAEKPDSYIITQKYVGEVTNEMRHGRGVMYAYGSIPYYKGEFRTDKYHGQGKLILSSGEIYEGEFKNGERTGKGTLTLPNGTKCTGEFVGGKMEGKGVLIMSDGTTYKGEFAKGLMDGNGVVTFSGGEVYDGEWKLGKRHGQGTVTDSKGNKYVGSWENGERSGRGIQIFSSGKRYEGEFKNDAPNGQGTLFFPDGSKYEGGFKNGKRHGSGRMTHADGQVTFGEWKNGELIEGDRGYSL